MRKMYIIMAMVVGLFAMSCNDDFTPPATLAESFRNAYPNAVDVEWERERGHRVAEFKLPGVSHDCEAWFTKSGNWVLTEYAIDYSELPDAVRSAFESAWGTQTPVDSVRWIERNGAEDVYFIEIEQVEDGVLVDVYLDYSPDGELLRRWVEVDNYDNVYYYI